MVFMRFVTLRLVDEKMKETNLEFLLFWNFFGFFFFLNYGFICECESWGHGIENRLMPKFQNFILETSGLK